MSEFPAPGEWQHIGPTTSVMEVPGGCVMKEIADSTAGITTVALCFIPYRDEALGKAMESWIRDAVERCKGE